MSAREYLELRPSDELSSRLYIQKQKGQFCDITLILCDVHFPVHSCVASSSSGYVEKELSSRDNKVMSPSVIIDFSSEEKQQFCRECAEKVVNFMYCCAIQVDSCHMTHIHSISKRLEILELVTLLDPPLLSVSPIIPPSNTVSGGQSSSTAYTDATYSDVSPKGMTNGHDINSNSGRAYLEQEWASEDPPSITCPKCKESFSNDIMLQQHCNTHLEKFYSCYVCSYSTLKVPNLLDHLKDANHAEAVCSLCLYEADSHSELQEHMKEHDHAQPFFCRTCYNRFQTRTALNSHIVKHSTETPFLCTVCGRGFKWKQGLQSHMITHTSTKNHLCDQCGYSTAHLKSFQDHKRIHSGTKFKCPISACEFSSARKCSVKQHLTTHLKEKSYQCEVCGQAFSQAKNLRRHAAIHDPGAQPVNCPFCPFQTMRSDKLKSHLRSCYKKQNTDATVVKERVKDKAVDCSKSEGNIGKSDKGDFDSGNVEIVETDFEQTVFFASNSSTDITSADTLPDVNQFLITTSDGTVLSVGQEPVSCYICNSDGPLPMEFESNSHGGANVVDVTSAAFQQCDKSCILQVEELLGPK